MLSGPDPLLSPDYRTAREAYAVVQTGERRLYANIMLTEGVVP